MMFVCKSWMILTLCGLLMSYGDLDLVQHWLRWWFAAWWHQTMIWTDVYLKYRCSVVYTWEKFHRDRCPNSKVHVAHMGPTWVLSAPGRPHVGPMNLAIRVVILVVLCETHPCLNFNNSLTHWGRHKINAILQTFSNAMKMFEFQLKFHWSLFLKVQLTIFQHWFR